MLPKEGVNFGLLEAQCLSDSWASKGGWEWVGKNGKLVNSDEVKSVSATLCIATTSPIII